MAAKKSKSTKKKAVKTVKKKTSKEKKSTPSQQKKKIAMKKTVANVVQADKKLIEWRKSLMEPAERSMIEFFLYPVAKNRMERDAAKKIMVESYVRGDEVVKQFILFLAHEQLSRAAGMKVMHNFSHYKKMFPKEAKGGDVRKAVYRTIFNYTTSVEGLVELIEFIGELGDTDAAKLLSYHLSYYSSMDSPALQVLRNATFDSLAHCNSPYALETILSYAKYADRNDRARYALGQWEKKLDSIELSPDEKKYYAKEIAKVYTGTKDKHEYYR